MLLPFMWRLINEILHHAEGDDYQLSYSGAKKWLHFAIPRKPLRLDRAH
jgi:hypothetical protein